MVTIEELLRIGKEKGASDVHITVGIPPKMRINGDLVDMDFPRLLPTDTSEIISTIMTDKQYKELANDGETDFSFSIPNLGRYRANVFNQRGSVAAAIRIVGTVVPKLEELGLPAKVVELYRKNRGLVLVTGPAGCGKSTTLAALIDKINENRTAHIITLEDPIEYLHQHKKAMVNQREIGIDSASYAHALKSALREDPDVILVGEMSDLDTISMAITAAETGHLVLSSLNTIGAAGTIARMIDVFPPHQQQQIRIQLSMVLEAVISQQLVPTTNKDSRVAAFEVMLADNDIRHLIREGHTSQIESIIRASHDKGMYTMDEALFELAERGDITGETAISFAQDVVRIESRLNN